ncbi:MAG: tyrosine-protein phosphatase [Clostridia bacterium]
MIDFHTHILPAIDDGSRNPDMSVQMIKRLAEQGVTDIVLSSHFYISHSSVEKFLYKREKSLNRLMEAAGEPLGVRLHLGAEVLYTEYLDKLDGLAEMAIGKTKYILLEMPFVKWTSREMDTVYKVICGGLTPIIAHFERYISLQGRMDDIYELKRMGCILQMNAENFKGFMQRRKAVRFFEDGTASLLGSDCHNTEKRPPEIKFAYDFIGEKLGDDAVRKINFFGEKILEKSEFVEV